MAARVALAVGVVLFLFQMRIDNHPDPVRGVS
jgi:hypothetical protein